MSGNEPMATKLAFNLTRAVRRQITQENCDITRFAEDESVDTVMISVLHSLISLADDPHENYKYFCHESVNGESAVVALLLCLVHRNDDVFVEAVRIICDLTDAYLLDESNIFVSTLIRCGILSVLVETLRRCSDIPTSSFSQTNRDCVKIIENLIDVHITTPKGREDRGHLAPLVDFLVVEAHRGLRKPEAIQNVLYYTDILANVFQFMIIDNDIETICHHLRKTLTSACLLYKYLDNYYESRTEIDPLVIEIWINISSTIAAVAPHFRRNFVDLQGVELCLRICRSRNPVLKKGAISILESALEHGSGLNTSVIAIFTYRAGFDVISSELSGVHHPDVLETVCSLLRNLFVGLIFPDTETSKTNKLTTRSDPESWSDISRSVVEHIYAQECILETQIILLRETLSTMWNVEEPLNVEESYLHKLSRGWSSIVHLNISILVLFHLNRSYIEYNQKDLSRPYFQFAANRITKESEIPHLLLLSDFEANNSYKSLKSVIGEYSKHLDKTMDNSNYIQWLTSATSVLYEKMDELRQLED